MIMKQSLGGPCKAQVILSWWCQQWGCLRRQGSNCNIERPFFAHIIIIWRPCFTPPDLFIHVPQDADGNPMWDLGNMKRVVVRDFKGKTYIDIREYYVDKNTMDTRL